MTEHATGVKFDPALSPITVYISGPMRGYPRYNFDAFHEAEDYLKEFWRRGGNRRVTVINPASEDEWEGFDPDDTSVDVTPEQLEKWMRRDVTDVAASDRILLLEGWEKSEGARRELAVARWCGVDPWLFVDGHTTQPDVLDPEGDVPTIAERYDVLAEICNEADAAKATAEKPQTIREAYYVAVAEAERELAHKLSADCWCEPEVVDYSQPEQQKSMRASALEEARDLITGDRNNSYGPPHQDFQRSADALTAIMGEKLREGERFHAHEIAQIVILIKLSRLQWTPTKRDSWVDIAGYAGCGLEAAVLAGAD